MIDSLDYQYMPYSNRLATVYDLSDRDEGFKDGLNAINNINDFVYDTNGNMISDLNKEISLITYNHLNLPERIEMTQGVIEYFYDATGVKQQKRVTEGSNVTETFYAGQFVYKRTDVTTPLQDFEFYFTPEGYAKKENGVLSYVYQYKDHLGNIRLSYQKDGNGNAEIIEENNYYPFGLKHQGYNIVVNGSDHPYGFGGKEEQNELGLDWIDVTARNYDPAIGRWMNIDPLAEQMRRHSPYNYAFDNPVYFIDPDGMKPIRGKYKGYSKTLKSVGTTNYSNKVTHSGSAYGYKTNITKGFFPNSTITSHDHTILKVRNNFSGEKVEMSTTTNNEKIGYPDFIPGAPPKVHNISQTVTVTTTKISGVFKDVNGNVVDDVSKATTFTENKQIVSETGSVQNDRLPESVEVVTTDSSTTYDLNVTSWGSYELTNPTTLSESNSSEVSVQNSSSDFISGAVDAIKTNVRTKQELGQYAIDAIEGALKETKID